MDCIFLCVFAQPRFLDMLHMLLDSIYTYGALGPRHEVLIYTSSDFAYAIRRSPFMRPFVRIETRDDADSLAKVCCARLDFFALPSAARYARVLYMDTDVIVKAPLAPVFDACVSDILYAVEEGVVGWSDHWGASLFEDPEVRAQYMTVTAFNSGVLLFRNCSVMRALFDAVNADRAARPQTLYCPDQAYLNYHAVTKEVYDNQTLRAFAVNNDTNARSDKVIHHFPGTPGSFVRKLETMRIFARDIVAARARGQARTPAPSAAPKVKGTVFAWPGGTMAFMDDRRMTVTTPASVADEVYMPLDAHAAVARIGGDTYRLSFDAQYTSLSAVRHTDGYRMDCVRTVPPVPPKISLKRMFSDI
jgi:hypothetical protein